MRPKLNEQCYSKGLTLFRTNIIYIAQKRKFPIKDFFSKCDQIRRKLRIWSLLMKKSLMENFIFCAVLFQLFNNGYKFVRLLFP